MRIVVIGGHGRTGILVVEKLLAAGHNVGATIRNAAHMADLVKRGAEVVMLDLDESPFDALVRSMEGADGVVFAAGSAEGEGSGLDRRGTLRTVRAAEKSGARRYVSISAIGVSTGLNTRSMSDEMKDYYKQKRAAGKHITSSELDWTILEPAELTDDPGTGRVKLSTEALEEVPISREDVAAVVAVVFDEPKTSGRIFQLTGGKTAIKTAVKAALK